MTNTRRFLSTCVGIAQLLLLTPVVAQQTLNVEPFGAPIDKVKIRQQFQVTALRMLRGQGSSESGAEHQKMLQHAPSTCPRNIRSLKSDHPVGRAEVYQHMVKATVCVGELYRCTKCNRIHVRLAGGVLISSDGLLLTNYHVLAVEDVSRSQGICAMTWDGKVWPLGEVLFADKTRDVALVRVKGNGHEFHAAAIADRTPVPTDPVRVISHPSGEYFVMTHGEVSRYITEAHAGAPSGGKSVSTCWMEITAPFGAGSSGCGVFNADGDVVGLASRIQPLMRTTTTSTADGGRRSVKFVEMVLRRCVPLSAIRSGFHAGIAVSAEPHTPPT